MRQWIEARVEEYDFLAGTAHYKMDWGAHEKLSARLVLAPKREGALVCLDAPHVQEQIKEVAMAGCFRRRYSLSQKPPILASSPALESK